MPLDWLNTPLDADIGDLIARKKRAKTIELLRAQLQGRMVPPVQMRLQLADLLVQAGREAEAIPVLIGLADEFAGDGFVAKAIAILKRVDKVQPGRPDVEERLASLVKQQQRLDAAPKPRSRRRAPEFGIEEIPPQEAEAAAAPPQEPVPEPAPAEDADRQAAPVPEAAAVVEAAAVPEAGAIPEAAAVVETPPFLPVEAAAPADTATTQRVRGVFRRFLASLPGTPPEAAIEGGVASSGDETVPDVPEAAVAAPNEETRADEPDGVAAAPAAPVEGQDEDPDGVTVVGADAIELDEPEPAGADDGDEETRPDAPAAETPMADAAAPPEAPRPDPVPADTPPLQVARPAAEEEPSSTTEPQGVGGRLRGALRWLVSSLGTAEQGGSAPEAPAAENSAVEARAEGASQEQPAPAEAAPAPAPNKTPEAAAEQPSASSTTPEAAAESQVASEASPVDGEAAAAADGEEAGDEEPMSDEVFEERLLDLAQDILNRPAARAAGEAAPLDRGMVLRYTQRLLATSLFGDLSEEELLAVVRGLRLHLHGPGDVLVTEGERGQSVFVLVSGAAKVFVRSPSGRNFPVAELREGDFFGEISSLSGRPRSATITASSRCELLELDRPTMDEIARTHPRVAHVLEESYIRRASSPEAAAIRAVPMNDAGAERKAIEVLEAHFGQSRWDPRMRLRLADVLLKAGKYEDAVPVLIGLADDLARAGYPEKAIAVLKKIEKIRRRDVEVVNLAPLGTGAGAPAAAPTARRARAAVAPTAPAPAADAVTAAETAKPSWRQPTAEFFEGWLVDVLRDRVKRPESAEGGAGEPSRLGTVRGYGPGLSASPLFADFNDDELLAVIRGLRLLSFDTGDIIITEGEPGQSLFVLATGTVKVFVKDPQGRSVALVPLGEGAFFGEIATLSGRPRSATVTAASSCELLELDKPALEAILKAHPRVRDVLEEHYIARAGDPEAAAIRGTRLDDPARGGTA